MRKYKKDEVYYVSTNLLGGWLCVHEEMSEDEALDKMWGKIKAGGTMLEIPTDNKELFRDRLFGGWKCGDSSKRRHVYFALAHYTFLGGFQSPLTGSDREEIFQTLVEKNVKDSFVGSGKFTRNCELAKFSNGRG